MGNLKVEFLMLASDDIINSLILFESIKNIMLELRKVNKDCEPLLHTTCRPNLRSDRFIDEIYSLYQ